VQKNLKRDGYNELPSQKQRPWYKIFLNVLREPMLAILLIIAVIYFFTGEKLDALVLAFFSFGIIGTTFYQQYKTDRTLEALRNLSSPRALVVRSGRQFLIPGREVVVDDIIIVREGDRVPADAVIIEQMNLMADESLLTGESLALKKDDKSFIYSGSLITQGWGIAKVVAVGVKTKMGSIGVSLQTIEDRETLLHKETKKLVLLLSVIGALCCLFLTGFYIVFRGEPLEGFLAGLTLAMSLLPEEIPVVLMIFLALGAWRLAKHKVLTRNQAAIETLGAITVLCVDKTGTITQNKMDLQFLSDSRQIYEINAAANSRLPLAESFAALLEYAVLASQRQPFDPLEIEIKRVCQNLLPQEKYLHNDWRLVKEYPFEKKLFALSHAWQAMPNSDYIIAAKGAPEAIADLCHFDSRQTADLMSAMQPLIDRGLRLIAVAYAEYNNQVLPENQHDFEFKFCGLLGFCDPIRKNAPEAVKMCQEAGVRICMITGDYPETAQTIGRQIGLANPDFYLTGADIENLSDDQLKEKFKNINIFARVMPEQKLRIIKIFQSQKQITAMTGDGVNDAPALKAADIGIAMGESGTDVAREAADLVLLDSNLSSIVNAVALGRRIFDNLREAVTYIFAVHIPIAGIALLPVVLGMPSILMPAHIAFLEMIIDPACTIVFEAQPAAKNIMKRPPRRLSEKLFGQKAALTSLMEGIGALAIIFGVLKITLALGASDGEARAITFVSMVLVNIALIISNFSLSKGIIKTIFSGNKTLFGIIGLSIAGLAAITLTPVLRGFFHFELFHYNDLLFICLAAFISLLWFDLAERFSAFIFKLKQH